jgi:hypothetical protein
MGADRGWELLDYWADTRNGNCFWPSWCRYVVRRRNEIFFLNAEGSGFFQIRELSQTYYQIVIFIKETNIFYVDFVASEVRGLNTTPA